MDSRLRGNDSSARYGLFINEISNPYNGDNNSPSQINTSMFAKL